MSVIADLIEGMLEGTGWAAGVAVVLGVAAVASRRDSPLVKEVVRGYLLASDKLKEVMAEAGEQLTDLYAEAKAEYEAAGLGAMIGAPTAESAPRRRGRPPRTAEAAPASGEAAAPRRRGRPPRAETTAGEPAPARRRGRPPRSEAAAGSEGGSAPQARRRGRPRAAEGGAGAPAEA